MRNHRKLRAFELADKVYLAGTDFWWWFAKTISTMESPYALHQSSHIHKAVKENFLKKVLDKY